MRKGFTLAEMVALIVVFTFISLALAPIFATLITDIPGSYRVFQENTSVLNMLKQMRSDIDAAEQLPQSFAGLRTDDELLLIKSADGCIWYQLEEGKVLRGRLTETGRDIGEDKVAWSVPKAKVEWQVWRKNGAAYAVEVRTHIKHNYRGWQQKKMANSHVYFVRAFEGATE